MDLFNNTTSVFLTDDFSIGDNVFDTYERNSSICRDSETQTTELYRFITNGILLNLIGILGILGNVISMIILSRPQMRSSINYILIGLARVDTVLIITSILLFGIPGIYPYTSLMFTYFYNVYPHIVPVVYPLATAVQTASVYLTLMVSLDRFVAVCHPLKSRSLCTYGRARIYVVCITVFSVLYNVPRLWEATIIAEWDKEFNTTIYCARPTPLRINETYLAVYIHWCYLIFIYLIPFFSLAVLNIAIYNQVRKANKERARLSRLQRREIGLATMLMCVVLVFFACNVLPLVINIIESFQIRIDADLLDRMIKTSNLLVTINSSINFIIYVIFGEKFKRLFLMLFCSHGLFGISGRDSPDGATHDDSFMSNGDRTSIRLHRQNTTMSRNGVCVVRVNGTSVRDTSGRRIRAPSPGPCVYYPGRDRDSRDTRGNQKEFSSAFTTQTSLGVGNATNGHNGDWSPDGHSNGHHHGLNGCEHNVPNDDEHGF